MAWVRLNVGGEMLETALATVTKYPESQLAKVILSAQSGNTEDMETAVTWPLAKPIVYKIDCGPESFKQILSWLR